MARLWVLEPVQARKFYIADIPNFPEHYAGESLSTRLGPATLLAGVTTMTAPEVTAEITQVMEATMDAPADIITGVSFNSITLTRGVYLIDPEFYSWIRMAMRGETFGGMFRRDLLMLWFHERLNVAGIPVPIRAFLLKDAIPIRFKEGSDFDANSSEISIQELEIKPREFEDIDISSLLNQPNGTRTRI